VSRERWVYTLKTVAIDLLACGEPCLLYSGTGETKLFTFGGGRRKRYMANRQLWQVLYWFIAGGLVGTGFIGFDIYFIFIPCLIVGVSLVIFGIMRWGTGRLWAAFLGFGSLPALFLLNDIIRSSPPCPSQGLTIPAGAPPGITVSCGSVSSLYYILLACFGIIALVAGTWPILRRRTHR
jgi:hypothetical protein